MPSSKFGLGLVKGLALTAKHVVARPIITTQYPEERLNNSRRLRGPEVIWVEMKCTGCATCAKSCPQGNIVLETAADLVNNRYKVLRFEIDHGRCMFCGNCVEACPFDALYMGRGYERASYRRQDLVLPKEKLPMGPDRQPSAYCRPEMEPALPPQTLLVYGKTKGD